MAFAVLREGLAPQQKYLGNCLGFYCGASSAGSLTECEGTLDDERPPDGPSPFVSPPRQRHRITARLRAVVVEAYESGQTSRQVAEELALGRTTVLKILKTAGATVRPQGRR
jgi:hypothetical protein